MGHVKSFLNTKGTTVTKETKALNGIDPNRRFHPDLIADRRTDMGRAKRAYVFASRVQRPGSLLVSASPSITFVRFLVAIAVSRLCYSDLADYIPTWEVADTSKHHGVMHHHWAGHFH